MSLVKLSSAVLLGSVLVAAAVLGAGITVVHVPVPSVLAVYALFPAAFLGAVMGWASVRPAVTPLSVIHIVTDTTNHGRRALKAGFRAYTRK